MIEKIKMMKSHIITATIALIVGIGCALILVPQKVVTQTLTVEKEVIKEVQKVVYVDKIVTKNVYTDRVIERKITRKDGTIEEIKIVDKGKETNTNDTKSITKETEKSKNTEKVEQVTVSQPVFKPFQIAALVPTFPSVNAQDTRILFSFQPLERIPLSIMVSNPIRSIDTSIGVSFHF